jgi:multidrug resistance efflux pump
MRSLEADGFRRSLWGILFVAALLSCGGGWFFLARIDLYELSRHARLESAKEIHRVDALVPGRIVTNGLVLGRIVKPGEVLAELDSEGDRLLIEEQRARLLATTNRLEALRQEMKVEGRAWREKQMTARLAIDEARARQREADAGARFAEDEAGRVKRLEENGSVSKSDLHRIQADAEQRKAAASALALTVRKTESEEQAKEQNHEARLAKLNSETALLEGEIVTTTATIKRLEYEIEKRLIRAPVAGQVAEVTLSRAGSYVEEGDKLGAIVPPGELRVIGLFAPYTAVGRIRAGQPARLRLDGFPWAQYGAVDATVARVANEPHDGDIRVEFAVHPNPSSLVPLQHGLPGVIEVKVARVSPAALVLRAAGELISNPGPAAGPPNKPPGTKE